MDFWPLPVALLAIMIFFLLPDRGLRRARLKQWKWSPNAGLILFVVALLGGMMGIQIVSALMGPGPAEIELMDIRSTVFRMLGGYIGQIVVLLLVPGFIWGLIRARQDPVDPERVPFRWWSSSLSGLGGLALFFPIVMATGLIVGLAMLLITGKTLPEMGHATLVQLQNAADTPDVWFVVIIILIAIVTPFIEEVMYRGLLQESIRRSLLASGESPWLSIVITSILFQRPSFSTWECLVSHS